MRLSMLRLTIGLVSDCGGALRRSFRPFSTTSTIPAGNINSSSSSSSSSSRSSSALSAADVFERILRERNSMFDISPAAVDDLTIKRLLGMTLTAPSSFNTQPYKIVMVRSEKQRIAVSESMMAGNIPKVKNSPLVAVFLADLKPLKSIDKLVALETGVRPAGYLSILPAMAEGMLGGKDKDAVVHAGEVRAWAYKNAAFAAQTYMLSATALGLRTCPMEGFDSSKLAAALKLPADRYDIPLVIATGYPTPGAAQKVRTRFDVSEMCFDDEFGKPFN